MILWAVRIRTKPADGEPPERYRMILETIRAELVHGGQRPEVAGVEDQRPVIVGATARHQTNDRALHGLVLQGVFHGWMAGSAIRNPIPVHEIRTEHVKIALAGLGSGRAKKQQIRRSVALWHRAPGVKPNLSEHAADAVGVALAAIRVERQRRLGLR